MLRNDLRPGRVLSFTAALVLTLAACSTGVDSTSSTSAADSTTSSTTTVVTTSVPPSTVPATMTTASPTTTEPPPTTARPTTTKPAPTTTEPSPTTTAATPAFVVRQGDTAEPVVALTFDAGSDCGNANAILDVLAANGIRATFGLTGRWVENCPAEAERIGDEGHRVMNHSYSHPSFTGFSTGEEHLTEAEIIDQLERGEDAIIAATGHDPLPLFRPPYGDYDTAVNRAAGRAGYRYNVMWTVDSGGWKGIDPDEVVTRVMAKIGNGAIVVMHVGSDSTDYEALQDLIDAIRDRGYRFDTVSNIL